MWKRLSGAGAQVEEVPRRDARRMCRRSPVPAAGMTSRVALQFDDAHAPIGLAGRGELAAAVEA